MGLCASASAETGYYASPSTTSTRPERDEAVAGARSSKESADEHRKGAVGPLLHSVLPGAKGEEVIRSGKVVLHPGSFLFEVSLSSICTRNLTAKDLLSSDPFVRFRWENHATYETRYFKKARAKARFPETFAFLYASTLADLSKKELIVEVLDWNLSGHNTFIGATKVRLEQIARGPVHHDHELLSTEGSPAGRVSFNCTMQTTDSWKVSIKGVHVIYKNSVLTDERFKGCPFKLQYRYIDYLSRTQNPTHAIDFEMAKQAFGTMHVVSWDEKQLKPLRWGGSFLKFITGSLQFELFRVQINDDGDIGQDGDDADVAAYLERLNSSSEQNYHKSGREHEGQSKIADGSPNSRFKSLAKSVMSFAREKRQENFKRRLSSRDNIIQHETASGSLWMSLKRLYSMSKSLPPSSKVIPSIHGDKDGNINGRESSSKHFDEPLRKTSLLSDESSKAGQSSGKSTARRSLTLTSARTYSVDTSDSMHSIKHKASGTGRQIHWTRREADFDEDLWLDGQKVGSISGAVVFERVPPIGQMASGVMTENGIAAASPVIVGEKRGGPIFRLLAGQKTGALPEAVKRLGKIFADLSHMNIRRKGAEKKQRHKMKHLIRILRESDKYSMVSWVYSDFEALSSTQKLLLTIGNWLMDRVEAVETSYKMMSMSFVGIVLVLSRGELSDLSTLGFDPMNSSLIGNAPEKSSASDGLPKDVTDKQLDIAILIRKFLVRCLCDSVSRVRFKIKDSKESLRLCAKIFAICSFRIPEFGSCMARALVPIDIVQHNLAAWGKHRGISLDDLSERRAVNSDENFESYFHAMGYPSELGVSFGISPVTSSGQVSGTLRQQSLVHSAHMKADPASLMMDWRWLGLILRRHRGKQIEKQNNQLPKSCLDPELVDEITVEASVRDCQRRGGDSREHSDPGKDSNEVKQASRGKKIRLKSNSIIKGERPAPIDVNLKIEDFPTMEAYRAASQMQQALILEQGWVLRLRSRQHFFLLVAQEWIQEVLDVVALVQRNVQWYQIPWYNHLLKAILHELEKNEVCTFSESLVLLSRALISNPDVLSPLVSSITSKTQARSLADVTLGLAMIRSWFVAMSSWHLRLARGMYTLGVLNRNSLPADFQYDYLSSIMLKLFDDSLPFQVTQKALEFLYSIWDVIPSERAEIFRKKLLISGTFLNLMLHWERHVRRFFVYLLAARLLQRRKWCKQGGMPAVHFEDFVDKSINEDEIERSDISDEETSSEDSSDDEITIHNFASSSSSLDVTVGAAKAVLGASPLYGASEIIDSSPQSTHSSRPGSHPQNSGPPRLFLGAPDSGLHSSRFSVLTHADNKHAHTPTAAGKKYPKGSRIVMLSENSTDDLIREHAGDSPLSSTSTQRAAELASSLEQKSGDASSVSAVPPQTDDSGQKTSNWSSSRIFPTQAMDRMAALIRILRRQVRDYEKQRHESWVNEAACKSWNKDTQLLDAMSRPGNTFTLGSTVDELHKKIHMMKIEELTKDEVEFGGASSRSNTSTSEGTRNFDRSFWGDDLDPNCDPTAKIHPLLGGESLNYLLDKNVMAKDEACLKKGVMWDKIEKPGLNRLAYAKDALRMFTLAARRINAIRLRVKEADKAKRSRSSESSVSVDDDTDSFLLGAEKLQVPELTFVALVKDEKGMYKNATKAKKDMQSNLD